MAAKKNPKPKTRTRTVTLCDRDSVLAGRVEFAGELLEILNGLVSDLKNTISFDDDEDSAEKTDLALAISRRTVWTCCNLIRKLRAIDAQKIGKKPAAAELPS